MKIYISTIVIVFSLIAMNYINSKRLYAQGLTIEEIKANLWYNPPNIGDSTLREQTIIDLDEMLKIWPGGAVTSDIIDFYAFMENKVNSEIKYSVNGPTIWMMYNHGFIVKTEQVIFAFDLVPGPGFNIPSDKIINKIKVLFVSHEHGDHYNIHTINTVLSNGGYVVVPSEISSWGNVPMAAGDSLTLMGLKIKAHYGLHSDPVRIFEVTTPGGLKLLHTGDNQTSVTLPNVDSVDVLLLNAWVNESGATSAVIGMRNSINVINPELMIPGHIHELNHVYNPSLPASRVPYEWAFEVDDVPIPSKVKVMAWGERYFVSEEYNKLLVYGGQISSSFLRLNIDTLIVQSEIYNPENRNLHVNVIINSADSTFEDSILLYDDGNHNDSLANDGIWGNKVMPVSIENEYITTVSMVDLDSGTYFILNDMARFTSIGPVIFEEYSIHSTDTIPNPGDRIKFKFSLRNMGMTTTANNITTTLMSIDTFATLVGNIMPNYGDIAAGSISTGNKNQYIKFSANCPDSINVKFKVDISSNGYMFWSDTFSVFVHKDPTGMDTKDKNILKEFALKQNYPNPFNPNTTIEFSIPNSEFVALKIYNILGQEVATLVDQKLTPGNYKYSWDATFFANGVYLYKIIAGNYQQTKKMILMK
jgi:L-ascorbate metabolism protein UlaG (beta-lactamase superfamily)